MSKLGKLSKYTFIVFCGYLLLLIVFGTNKQSFGQQPEYESHTVYDTIFVYDTIWTYETVYDTVWIYDTIYSAPAIQEHLSLLTPASVSLPEQELPKYLLTINSQPKIDYIEQPKNKPKRKTTHKKNNSSSYNYQPTGASMLTLNPTKGVFDPSLFLKGTFSLEGYGGLLLQQTQYSFFSEDERNQNIKNSVTDLTGQEFGILLNYDLFQISFKTGIVFSKLQEKLSYKGYEYYQDSTKHTTPAEKFITVFDTVQVLNLDEYLRGNIVYESYPYQYDSLVYVDSIYYKTFTDSTQVEKSEQVSHSMLEVPLLFSYKWQFPRSAIQLTLGGYNQFHLFSKGKAFSDFDTVSEIENAVTFTKYNLALYGSIGYKYYLFSDINIGINAYYKYPLKQFYQGFNATIYKQTYGVSLSICYHF